MSDLVLFFIFVFGPNAERDTSGEREPGKIRNHEIRCVLVDWIERVNACTDVGSEENYFSCSLEK